MNIHNIADINSLVFNKEIMHVFIWFSFGLMLLAAKPFEIFPRPN